MLKRPAACNRVRSQRQGVCVCVRVYVCLAETNTSASVVLRAKQFLQPQVDSLCTPETLLWQKITAPKDLAHFIQRFANGRMIESKGEDDRVLKPLDGLWSEPNNCKSCARRFGDSWEPDNLPSWYGGCSECSERRKLMKQLTGDEILQAAEAPTTAPQVEATPPGFLSTLKPHQKRALAWMLHKEHADGQIHMANNLHPLWRAWLLPNGGLHVLLHGACCEF